MDDKESKNIDGVKMPQSNDDLHVDIGQQPITATENQDVEINSNGDYNSTPETKDSVVGVNPVAPPSHPETKAEPQSSVPLSEQDPGIVPSQQPPQQSETSSPATELVRLKEKNKNLKIWLVVLMLLLVGVASALVVYFAQQSKAKNDLKTQQQQNSQLQQQNNQLQQNSTQKTIDNLNQQLAAEKQRATDLQSTIDKQNQLIASYQTTIKQLLSACGTACSNITIPTATDGSSGTTLQNTN